MDFGAFFGSLRERLPHVIGLALLGLIVVGDLIFAQLQVIPAMQQHTELSAQLLEASQALSPPTGDAQVEALLQATVDKLQVALDEQSSTFLAESDVPVVLNHLYRYAEESGVQIAKVDATRATTPNAEPDAAHSVQSFQVEVNGGLVQLLDFATRFQEASVPAVVIDQFAIKPGKAQLGTSVLSMNLHLFISPYANGQLLTPP